MAEILGTTVGVLSLSIQVCQELVSYYQHYKDQDSKLGDIHRDVNILSNTLRCIQTSLLKPHYQQLDTIILVDNSITACAAAIRRLEELLNKCHQATVPADFKERMKVLTRRAVFPFYQSTINDLRDAVKGLQNNLVVAVQTLQL